MDWFENKNLRTYTTKTEQKSFARRRTRFSNSMLHYDNSIRKIGDGVGGMRTIDKSWVRGIVTEVPDKVWNKQTEEYDEIQTITDYGSECYYYDFANDPCRAPLTASGLIRYIDYFKGRGYATAFKTQCNDVEGSVNGKDIVYNHAFTTGQDLILRLTNQSLQKLVRLRDYSVQDYTFDFEIIIENYTAKGLSIYRVDKTGQNETYLIDLMSLFTTPKVFDNPNRVTIIGKTENDGTVIKPPKAWYYDDENLRVSIDIETELYGDANTGKFYLRKHIPQSFLQEAGGKTVYTDTETTINPNSSYSRLGYKSDSGYNWVTNYVDDATINNALPDGDQALANYRRWGHGTYQIAKSLEVFDTSSLPSDAVISAAHITFYNWEHPTNLGINYTTNNTGNTTLDYVAGVPITVDETTFTFNGQATSYLGHGTATDQYNCFEKVHVSDLQTAGILPYDPTNISLNSYGLSQINTSGNTSFLITTGFEIERTAGPNIDSGVYFRWWDSLSAYPPELVVDYTLGLPSSSGSGGTSSTIIITTF